MSREMWLARHGGLNNECLACDFPMEGENFCMHCSERTSDFWKRKNIFCDDCGVRIIQGIKCRVCRYDARMLDWREEAEFRRMVQKEQQEMSFERLWRTVAKPIYEREVVARVE